MAHGGTGWLSKEDCNLQVDETELLDMTRTLG